MDRSVTFNGPSAERRTWRGPGRGSVSHGPHKSVPPATNQRLQTVRRARLCHRQVIGGPGDVIGQASTDLFRFGARRRHCVILVACCSMDPAQLMHSAYCVGVSKKTQQRKRVSALLKIIPARSGTVSRGEGVSDAGQCCNVWRTPTSDRRDYCRYSYLPHFTTSLAGIGYL